MAFKLLNNVKQALASTGTGALNLGAAKDGHDTFVGAGMANGDTTPYYIKDGAAWEYGIATLTTGAPDSIARSVGDSSDGGTAINVGADATVTAVARVADMVRTEDGQTGAAVVPAGTAAQRPGTPAAGHLRFNSDDGAFEGHDGSGWAGLGGAAKVDDLSDGTGPESTASWNWGIGESALSGITSGTGNVALGRNAGSSITTGGNNVCIGSNVGAFNTNTGSKNVRIGTSQTNGISGSSNIVLGSETLAGGSTAARNVVIGELAGFGITSGSDNTCLGDRAGMGTVNLSTGTNCTLLGANSESSASGATNEITLGDANITTLRCNQTTITALSDARDKANISDLSLGLEYLEKVRPVEFDWRRRIPDANDGKHQAGFIAQDLMAVEDEHGAEFLGSVLRSNPDRLEAGPAALIPVMVKAIQELSARVKELEAQNA